MILDSTACGAVDLSRVQSIWWRRPTAPTIPGTVNDYYIRAYCRSETDQLLRGVLASLNVPIYNDPDAEAKAARKPYHLSVASGIGLRIPDTLMSCSARRASQFCAETQPVIFKPFRAPAGSLASTREYNEALSDKLFLLNNAPSIFQERVAPFRDVRVSVIGNKILSGVSQSKLIDWRMDAHLTWTAHELPAELKRLSLALVRKLGLSTGHLDFRLTPDGDYVFFEINPSGQFLFLEVDDSAIEATAAMADLLLGPAPNRKSIRVPSHTPAVAYQKVDGQRR